MELLSEKIKILRLNKGWKLRHFAEKTGISAASLSEIERGGGARPDNLKKIADALGVEVRTLIKGDVQDGEKSVDYPDVSAQRYLPGVRSSADPFAQARSDLAEIFKSGDEVIMAAIMANLYSFKRSVHREAENRELRSEMDSLKTRLAAVEEKLNK